jgi:hypothetical protein
MILCDVYKRPQANTKQYIDDIEHDQVSKVDCQGTHLQKSGPLLFTLHRVSEDTIRK